MKTQKDILEKHKQILKNSSFGYPPNHIYFFNRESAKKITKEGHKIIKQINND